MFDRQQEKEYAIFNRADMYYRNVFERIYPAIFNASLEDNLYAYYSGVKGLYMYVQPFLDSEKQENEIRKTLKDCQTMLIAFQNHQKSQKTVSTVQKYNENRGKVKSMLDSTFLSVWQLMKKKDMLIKMGMTDSRPAVVKEKYT